MKKFNVYELYMDDGKFQYKATVPAPSKAEAKKYVEGNGEVIAVKNSELQDINIECLTETLKRNGWGQKEIDIITRTLIMVGLERM